MTQALAVQHEMSVADLVKTADLFAKSGFFSDAREMSKAFVKIQAGRELGIGPAASMKAIHVIQNTPTLSANVIAAKVKGSSKYDYRVIETSEEQCEIAFFEGNEELGRSTFTMHDARKAALGNKPNWEHYPRNMLFSRAMSNGARWYCPDAFAGITVYTPEELGAEVDGESGDIIDVTPRVVEREPKPETRQEPVKPAKPDKPANGLARPLTADQLQNGMREKAKWVDGSRLDGEPVSEKQTGAVAGLLEDALGDMAKSSKTAARHDVLEYLYGVGVRTTSKLTSREASAIISWLKVPGDEWDVNEWAVVETARILEAFALEKGQQELPM